MQAVKNCQAGTFDHPSWVASPCGKHKPSLPEYRFTWIDVFIIVFSMATFFADIVTDVLVMLVYWKNDENAWAALTLTFFIVPAIIMQVFSARWFLADGHKMTWSMIVIHLLMMAPIRRYISVLRRGFKARKTKRIEDYQCMYSELSDVSMLRLFECFLESAPQLVLQLNIIIRVEGNDYILTGISACFSLLSLSWAIVAYTRALRAAANTRHRVSLAGSVVHGLWRGGMLVSRLTAILMFATVFQEWTLLFLGLHWLLMTAWIIYQDTDFCNTWWEERLFNMIIGIIYVFCFFNMKEGKSRYRLAFYYVVVLVENSVMILLWWPRRTQGKWYNKPALSSVWIGFALGLLCMVLYYLFFHPASNHRCHCCMAWRKLTFMCQTYCCNHEDQVIASPYKPVDNKRHFFDSTDSSEEVLDYRDFTELRSSYDFHKDENDATESASENLKNSDSKDQLQVSTYDHLDCSEAKAKVVVVGDAQMGFRVKQMTPQLAVPGLAARSRKYVAMPLPNATSTPGDDLKVEKKNPLGLETPSKPLKPGCPNTLVRNWVKKTQEMYEARNLCFSEISGIRNIETDNERDGCENMQRRHPIKMKSFSKRDRLGPTPSFLRRNKKRKGSTRNSFREAFGFHVIDLDNIKESCDLDRITPRKTKKTASKNANAIRHRIDKPPPQLRIDEVTTNLPILREKMPEDDSVDSEIQPSASARTKEKNTHKNYCETSLNKIDHVSFELQIDNDGHQSARKKLNFKASTTHSKVNRYFSTKAGNVAAAETTPRRVLGAVENLS